MDNTYIRQEIYGAKDQFGVISADSIQNIQKEFGHMSAGDWKQAAQIFSKDASNPDGFYIEDNNGNVNIHNDLTEAHKIGDSSALKNTFDDVKDDAKAAGELAVGMVGLTAGTVGAVSTLLIAGVENSWAAGLAAGAGAAFSIGTGTAEAAAVVGALAIGGDVVRNIYRGNAARNDINNSASVSLQTAAG